MSRCHQGHGRRLPFVRVAAALSITSLLLVSCSEGGSPPGVTGPPSESGVVVRSGDRIAWDQRAPSVGELGAYTFRLYLDGTAATLDDVRCESTPGPSGYGCSGRLPAMSAGPHALELAARLGSVEGARSTPLAVNVRSVTTSAPPQNSQPGVAAMAHASPAQAPVVCVEDSAPVCYDAALSATGAGTVTATAATSDGRLLFVEDHRRVRIVDGDRLMTTAALTLEAPDSRITGVAVDPDFGRTHTAYVAWTERRGDSQISLNVSRYRELRGSFGEGAVILTGVGVLPTTTTPLAVDAEGAVYLAVPAASDDMAGSEAAFNRRILRVSRDGGVPATNPLRSPVVAEGYAHPTALIPDGAGRRIWIAGVDPYPVASFATDRNERAEWPVIPEPAVSRHPGDSGAFQETTLAMTAGPSTQWLWLVPSPGIIYRGSVEQDGRLGRLGRVPFEALGAAGSIAEGPAGSLYVVTRSLPGSGEPFWTIWRLTQRPRPSR